MEGTGNQTCRSCSSFPYYPPLQLKPSYPILQVVGTLPRANKLTSRRSEEKCGKLAEVFHLWSLPDCHTTQATNGVLQPRGRMEVVACRSNPHNKSARGNWESQVMGRLPSWAFCAALQSQSLLSRAQPWQEGDIVHICSALASTAVIVTCWNLSALPHCSTPEFPCPGNNLEAPSVLPGEVGIPGCTRKRSRSEAAQIHSEGAPVLLNGPRQRISARPSQTDTGSRLLQHILIPCLVWDRTRIRMFASHACILGNSLLLLGPNNRQRDLFAKQNHDDGALGYIGNPHLKQ
ncbi:hypothetical protein B0T24DRAFT_610222 [Lasiosphaeria ovina]|uniref:Uncharacterized protein n=1 Tax=Lasiosphaeria ovina TaxID=92902 RepID=A0AAE0KLE1_9PEZI|nr:hypothetical protein B0T24DRAFT_610222 [Lasiosphaeria ovina]